MTEPGQKLKRARERLNLRYRDVEEASLAIANRHGIDGFVIALSRLADIENKGTVPSLFRLYSLCAIYRLDFSEVLSWYGIPLGDLMRDSSHVDLEETHLVGFEPNVDSGIRLPSALLANFDARQTTFLARTAQQWGEMPLSLLRQLDLKRYRYGFIGSEDWSMYPIIPPSSFVQIDETKQKIVDEDWASEYERPVYFLEHRDQFYCGWCSEMDGAIILQPHPASNVAARAFRYPDEVDVVGQIVGVAKRMYLGKPRHTRS
jgi:transcriptional regulator with XRE-family HTH domain